MTVSIPQIMHPICVIYTVYYMRSGCYNRNIDKWLARKFVWLRESMGIYNYDVQFPENFAEKFTENGYYNRGIDNM